MRKGPRLPGVIAAWPAMHGIAAAAKSGAGEAATVPPAGTEENEGDLAKAAQNPVADLISVPFQNNTAYNVGPNKRATNSLNIQPVIPVHLEAKALLILPTAPERGGSGKVVGRSDRGGRRGVETAEAGTHGRPVPKNVGGEL